MNRLNNEWKYIFPRGNVRKTFLNYQLKELAWVIKTSKQILKKLKLIGGDKE